MLLTVVRGHVDSNQMSLIPRPRRGKQSTFLSLARPGNETTTSILQWHGLNGPGVPTVFPNFGGRCIQHYVQHGVLHSNLCALSSQNKHNTQSLNSHNQTSSRVCSHCCHGYHMRSCHSVPTIGTHGRGNNRLVVGKTSSQTCAP